MLVNEQVAWSQNQVVGMAEISREEEEGGIDVPGRDCFATFVIYDDQFDDQ